MDDAQRLEEHRLDRARLVGGVLHGRQWRHRRVRGTLRRLVVGLVLAVVAGAVIAAASFVSAQLGQQREEQRQRKQQVSSAAGAAAAPPTAGVQRTNRKAQA